MARGHQQKDLIKLIPGEVKEELDIALAQSAIPAPPPTPGKIAGDSNSCNRCGVSVNMRYKQMALGSERQDRSFPAWVKRQGWCGAGGGGIPAGAGQWEDNWAVLGPGHARVREAKSGRWNAPSRFPQ